MIPIVLPFLHNTLHTRSYPTREVEYECCPLNTTCVKYVCVCVCFVSILVGSGHRSAVSTSRHVVGAVSVAHRPEFLVTLLYINCECMASNPFGNLL